MCHCIWPPRNVSFVFRINWRNLKWNTFSQNGLFNLMINVFHAREAPLNPTVMMKCAQDRVLNVGNSYWKRYSLM